MADLCPAQSATRSASSASLSPSPLSIGEPCPDAPLSLVTGAQKRLSSYSGKSLVLVFMSIYCGTCVQELPQLQSLQDQFRDSLTLLLILSENRADVAAFFSSNAYARKSHLPIVTNAGQLSKRFPHVIVPHIVWLDHRHVVAAITDNRAITESNLRLLATAQPLHLRQKKDLLHFDEDKPVLTGIPQDGNASAYVSALGGFIDGAGSSSGIHHDDSLHTRYLSLNVSIPRLYQTVTGLPRNLILPEVRNTSRLRVQNTPEWEERNLCTYELMTPASLPFADAQRLQKADFDRYLGYRSGFESRPLPVWALVRQDTTAISSSDTERVFRVSGADSEWTVRSVSGAELVNALNNMAALGGPVFLDETGGGSVSLHATVRDVNDIPSLQKALQPNGLRLVKRTQIRDVFVIRDADDTSAFSSSP